MMTFLPYKSFFESAHSLDKKRCWCQVKEAKQIICCLNFSNLPKDWQESKSFINKSWKHHPIMKMWVGYEDLLKHYYNIFLLVCLDKHKINTKLKFLTNVYSKQHLAECKVEGNIKLVYSLTIDSNQLELDLKNKKLPFWFDNEDLYRSHRSRLIEKDANFYLDKFPNDKGFNDSKYFWPNNETKTYKVI